MVTREEALNHNNTQFHYTGQGPCKRIQGPRGGIRERIVRVRRSGNTKVQARNPEFFHMPVKYGLRDSYWINNSNAHEFHLASKCPEGLY